MMILVRRLAVVIFAACAAVAAAQEALPPSTGQTLYLPIYSDLWHGDLELFIERSESAGGSGASFLIRWQADRLVNPPVVETVHADLRNPRTISFITVARPIRAAE